MARKHGFFRPQLGRSYPQVATTTLREGGGPPAGYQWLSDFEGNPLYDALGVRLYGAI